MESGCTHCSLPSALCGSEHEQCPTFDKNDNIVSHEHLLDKMIGTRMPSLSDLLHAIRDAVTEKLVTEKETVYLIDMAINCEGNT